MHCLVKSEPKISPLSIVGKLKQLSIFRLWQMYETDLKRVFQKERTFCRMSTFIVRLAMPVRRPSTAALPVKGEMRRFIYEAEDLVVFAPDFIKEGYSCQSIVMY